MSEDVRRVGGWLAFFLVLRGLGALFTALRALSIFVALSRIDMPSDLRLTTALQSTILIALIFGADIYMLYSFLAWRRWWTVQVGILLLWLQAVPGVLSLRGLSTVFTNGGLMAVAIASFAPVVVAILSATLWTAYLLTSKRVAYVYRRPGHEAAELGTLFE